MKSLLIFLCLCAALLLGACETQSLITDEDYAKMKGPAPFSPDPMQHIPVAPDSSRGAGGY